MHNQLILYMPAGTYYDSIRRTTGIAKCLPQRRVTRLTGAVFIPAIIYLRIVIPAKAGIQNELDWMPDRVRHDILPV